LHPERDALIVGTRHVSYGELWTRVVSAARELADCGVERGDRVLLAAPSGPAFAFGYFGAHLIGAVAVPLDPHAPIARRDELMQRVVPKVAFGSKVEPNSKVGQIRSISELESLPAREPVFFDPPAPDSLADLLFTTGTTGRPKGVRLSHRNIAAAVHHINSVMGCRELDVEVMPLPLYHSFGLGRLRCCLVAGATIVLVDGFRLPGEIFTALERHRASGLVGVPAGFAVLLRFGARGLAPFSELIRYVEIGSAPMPIEHKRALMELLPKTQLWMHYGLTEATRSAFIEFHRHREHLLSAGRSAPGVRFDVRSEQGAILGTGETGLLWIGGKHVSAGYWDDPALTASTFIDGAVCSGDVAHLDDAGFVHLHGRKDDMINVGGFNVSPDEVEQVLREHPSVNQAACIGVPDPRNVTGQVVSAYLVPAADHSQASDADLSEWVAARIESYKVPTRFQWVATLPQTASGKLLRAVLRGKVTSEQ